MNDVKKLTKFVYIDTNIFYHCKFFTEIDWKSIFKENIDKVIIKVPYMVMKELDKGKYRVKRARNVLPKLRKLKDKEIKNGIELQVSIFPTKWESLESDWKEKLDKEDPDNRIIAEVLKFCKENPDYNVIFITGDNLPYLTAKEMGIKTIFWRDQEYKDYFQIQKVPKIKVPDLEVCFDYKERKKIIRLSKRKDSPDLMVFEKSDVISEDNSSLTLIENELKTNLEKSLTIPDEKYKKQIEEYNREIEEYHRYQKINLFLLNNGNITYNDIDVIFDTTLEKGFEIAFEADLDKPVKPTRNLIESMLDRIIQIKFTPFWKRKIESNDKNIPVKKGENVKNNDWSFGSHINKLKHGLYIALFPIMLKIPEKSKTNKVRLKINITHYEKGRIRSQNLFIILD